MDSGQQSSPLIIGTSSPFIIGPMITDPEKFWGRKSETYEILDRLGKTHSFSISGPRRIGKSSLAYHVYQVGSKELGSGYELVWLDGQSGHSASVQQFFKAVAKACSLSYLPANSLNDCLIRFEDGVKAHPRKPVIFINEFELLTTHFELGFYTTMRLLAEQKHLALVTVSQSRLRDLCKHILEVSSPFYNIFEEKKLQHFTTEEANAFLAHTHNSVTLTPKEVQFIQEKVKYYQHPLLLQIACDSVYKNRQAGQSETDLLTEIESRSQQYLNHEEVKEGRRLKEEKDGRLSKPLDMVISILVPVLGIGILMLEFGLLIRTMNNFLAVLLGLVTALLGFSVLIFAGRSIGMIGEATFYQLFLKIISQIPLISGLADQIIRIADKIKEDDV